METETRTKAIRYDKLFIGGHWIVPSTKKMVEVRSPHDQSLIGTTPLAGKADVDFAVEAATKAFQGTWGKFTPEERWQVIDRFNELHSHRAQELAELTSLENGSPIWFTGSLLESLKDQTGAYLRAAKTFPWEEKLQTAAGHQGVIRKEALGVVAAIILWNAPQQSALVKIIPALLAGNTVVFKPTPETSLDGIALGELFETAGLPDGVFNVVLRTASWTLSWKA